MSKRLLTIAGVVFFFTVVFGAGFVFFYNRLQRTTAEAKPADTDSPKSLINKPFPVAKLVDASGAPIDEQILRTGKVVVVFVTPDCDACAAESKFLQTVLDRRKDVTFYGLVPFGTRPDSPADVEKKFPFRIFYDEDHVFVMSMGINRVPVKVFLENGIITKGWIGAAQTDEAKSSFTHWLESLP